MLFRAEVYQDQPPTTRGEGVHTVSTQWFSTFGPQLPSAHYWVSEQLWDAGVEGAAA